jgi:hypothetical protein
LLAAALSALPFAPTEQLYCSALNQSCALRHSQSGSYSFCEIIGGCVRVCTRRLTEQRLVKPQVIPKTRDIETTRQRMSRISIVTNNNVQSIHANKRSSGLASIGQGANDTRSDHLTHRRLAFACIRHSAANEFTSGTVCLATNLIFQYE